MATVNDLIEQLESQDYDYYLDMMLDSVPEDIDTREGSVIYDALAPAATALAEQALNMANIVRQTYISTADGQFLDYKAAEQGTSRKTATHAKLNAKTTGSDGQPCKTVEVGDEFSSIGATPITYTVTEVDADYGLILEAQTPGTDGNAYTGQILPVTANDDLNYAEITAVAVPARDQEDDETLRARLLEASPWLAYGGNVEDYEEMATTVPGVGAVQVYPAWNGGGTVKLVVVDNDYMPASGELLKEAKEQIDPDSGSGYGLAPIDHNVTVVAPSKLTVDVTCSVTVDTKTTVPVVRSLAQTAIEAYFQTLRRKWATVDSSTGRGYSLTVYRARILATILNISGVVSADLPLLNGKPADMILTFDNETSQLPVLGTVTLNG